MTPYNLIEMKLFPHILTRTSGGQFENFNSTTSSDNLARVTMEIVSRRQVIEASKLALTENLLSFIQQLKDPKEQNSVQNVRRDIFNNRKVKRSKFLKAYDLLPEELQKEINAYFELSKEVEKVEAEAHFIYRNCLLQAREQIKRLATEETFQKGLILSSQTLLSRISVYASTQAEQFKKRELHIEQGIIKYLSRMYCKTSPFSTFTNLALGEANSNSIEPIRTRTPDTYENDANDFIDSGAQEEWTPSLQGMSAARSATSEAVIPDEKQAGSISSHIRINNYLFKYLKDLLVENKSFFLHFLLRPNPTIETKEDHYLFLINHNNVESFQRMPLNPVLDLILSEFQKGGKGILFNELTTAIKEHIEASDEELEAYLRQAISFGLLEYNFEISGTDPDWDIKLVKQLRRLEIEQVPLATELKEALEKIRALAISYGNGSIPNRKTILKDAYTIFRNICMKLHEAAGLPEAEREFQEEAKKTKHKETQEKSADSTRDDSASVNKSISKDEKPAFQKKSSTHFSFKPEQIFYEDSTRDVVFQLNEEKLHSFVEKLDALLHQLRLFKGGSDEKDKMFHYFSSKYGENARIRLLTFYEDYYREFKKPEAEWLKNMKAQERLFQETDTTKETNVETLRPDSIPAKKEPNPFSLKAIEHREKSWEDWKNKLSSLLHSKINSNQIEVDLDTVLKVNKQAKLNLKNAEKNSFGSFIQFFSEENQKGEQVLKGVLNASFMGYGKMISRFLHIFDEEVTLDVQSWNNSLNPENKFLFVADCDSSYFNANLHPPMLPYEIWMPGGHNSLPSEKQLPITDFEVIADQEKKELQLIHIPTKKRAFVFDLDFQGHQGRSQLFQLLEKFTMAEHLYVYPLLSAINQQLFKKAQEENKNAPGISIQPRVTFQEQIILQRKSWSIPKELFPLRQSGESNEQYFFNINQWRKKSAIPQEVFVTIHQNRKLKEVNTKVAKKLSRDDYKPQFISFNNPLLVLLFEKLLAKAPTAVKIEEMLPASEQLPSINGKKYVSEFVVHWYK